MAVDATSATPAPPARRRALLALVRAALTTTALTYVYFVAPLTGADGVPRVLLLALGLIAFVALLVWQIGSITRSQVPALRAVEVLATSVPLLLLIFSAAYFLLGRDSSGAFSQPLTRLDALYFTVTVFATVGFGDVVAVSETARIVVTLQMLADLIVIGIGARVVVGAVRRGQSRREERATAPTQRDGTAERRQRLPR